MALHPAEALDHVIEEHAEDFRMESRVKGLKLQEALERELDAPGSLVQWPLYPGVTPRTNTGYALAPPMWGHASPDRTTVVTASTRRGSAVLTGHHRQEVT